MIYKIFCRRYADNRAPEFINREDYVEVGYFEATSRTQAVVAAKNSKKEYNIKVGDVIVDESANRFIFTPTNQWAAVKVLESPEDQ